MAHFSEFKDKSDGSKVKGNDGLFNDRLRSLFDQVLDYFLKGVCINKDVIWGFPPKLSDGVEADLFTLFWVVRKIGDYELVSKNELWEFVAEECGLDTTHVASLKLIYMNYLKELDQWLTHGGGFKDMKLDNPDLRVLEKLDYELKGCRFSLPRDGFETDTKGKCVVAESSDNGGTEEFKGKLDLNIAINVCENDGLDFDLVKTEMGVSRINDVVENDEKLGGLDEKKSEFTKIDVSMIKDDDNKRDVSCRTNVLSVQSKFNEHIDTSDNKNNGVIFTKTIDDNVICSQKRRKAESLSLKKMLDWVANAARNPHGIMIGSIPSSSKWKKYKENEVWKQVLSVKETLFAKRNVDSGYKVYGSQKKRHMMHPSMYEDDKIPIHLSSKRIRCSQRVSSVKACSCPGCTSCSSSRNKRVKKKPQILETIQIQDDACEDQETESVNVGAEVPEWAGFVSESDPKWLGTRMWPPPEDKNGEHEADPGVIGKGRQSSCTCMNPASADCVRFHIAENRKKVERALGQLFYKWKFDHMGEEAALSSWSLEEESEFKSLVIKARQELADKSKSRHEIMNNFWRRASESIPTKTKGDLVSYYFNVFVLRRRSYQNRIMPENIDSDDDEQDMGHEKIDALSIKNTHCMNLDGIDSVH
ncbi:putative transcription factor & chromatin remodeling ARID family [Helianthus annuus]|nr:putative transcription factor & chromatin remodeling ARID family [Helianthus annuus]